MEMADLVKPWGIITYALLFLTILSGMQRWKLKQHKMLGLITIFMASVHALLVIQYY